MRSKLAVTTSEEILGSQQKKKISLKASTQCAMGVNNSIAKKEVKNKMPLYKSMVHIHLEQCVHFRSPQP